MNLFRFLFILFFILSLSISAVSAIEDNNTFYENDDFSNDILLNELSEDYFMYNNNDITINSNNYSAYFEDNGNMKDNIVEGDTINLDGTFNDKSFLISKSINLIGINTNLINCKIIISTGGSGSNISNLNIKNNIADYHGIFLSGATNCKIENCNITTNVVGSFGIVLDAQSNYNNVTSNFIKSNSSTDRASASLLLGDSHYNYLANNIIETGEANSIYLSSYGSGNFLGGISNNNIIFNNTIISLGIHSSWNYAIQIMGSNNYIRENKIYGAYRGISTSGSNNSIIGNILTNITGKSYSTNVLEGGDYAIYGSPNSVIVNNTIINSLLMGSGIFVNSNTEVYGNDVEVLGKASGIQANGNHVNIYNNIVNSVGVGIYQIGGSSNNGYAGLIVRNNNINSGSSVGVLIKKQSSKVYPTNITVVNNVINTTNTIALDASEADENAFTISPNTIIGGGSIVSPSGIVDPSGDLEFDGITYNINSSNFIDYFNDNGTVQSFIVAGDILNFEGDFYNKIITIDLGVKLTGNNPKFYNSTIRVTQTSGVLIENLTVINNNVTFNNQWGIYVRESNRVILRNNIINVTDNLTAYAIYLLDSGDINVYDNTLISHGNTLTYTFLMYSITDSKIRNNKIITFGTGNSYGFQNGESIDDEHNANEVYRTYGILALYSSNNDISSNNVSVSSLLNESFLENSTNSLVGIDLYFDCNNNTIQYNNINIVGNDNYIYGLGVLGAETNSGSESFSNNNLFAYNIVNIRGYNFGTGFIAGYHSINTSIIFNEISIISDLFAYGITLEDSENSYIYNNNVNISADIIYIIEAFDSDNNIIDSNVLYGVGKYVYGIAGYRFSNNQIYENNIYSLGNPNGNLNLSGFHGDVIRQGNSGIILIMSNSNLIQDNYISTLGNYSVIAINNSATNNIIGNYLKSNNSSGDNSVNVLSTNVVRDNYGKYFTNMVLNPVVTIINGIATFKVTVSDGGNSTVKFYIEGVYVGETKSVNGVATYNYQLNNSFIAGIYNISSTINEFNYKTEEIFSNLTISKASLSIEFNDINSLPGNTIILNATVLDQFNNFISGVVVEFYREGRYIGRNTTDNAGKAFFRWAMPNSLTYGSYSMSVSALGNENYLNASDEAVLYLGKAIPVYISANNVTMYYKNGSRYVVTLLDNNRNPFVNKEVDITINGATYTRNTDDNGQVSLALNLGSGIYEITALYGGNENYSAVNIVNSVNILTTIVGNNLVKYYKNDSQYSATFYDNKGNLLKDVDIEFNINGVFYIRTTDSNGVARLSINLNPDKYIITAINPSTTEQYSNNITVLSTLEGNNLVKFYGASDKYSVKVLDKNGNALVNTDVTMNINGVMYTRTSDSNGIVSLSINLNPNFYVITVSHPETGLLISNNITVYPTLYGNDTIMNFQDGSSYKVRLLTSEGKAYPNQNVTININGVFYIRTTDSEGIASLNINLNSGHYIATAEYGEYQTSNLIIVN